MTDSNSKPPDSPDPESEFTNQNSFEFSEFFKFDDHEWPDSSLVSEQVPNQMFYQPNEVSGVNVVGGSTANHFEGSSSSKPNSSHDLVILFCSSQYVIQLILQSQYIVIKLLFLVVLIMCFN